jgi:glycosyltransferase involved in cell wall biosynthesis
LDILRELNRFTPDIVILGGFLSPSNFIAYRWAKYHRKKVVVFTEISRNRQSVVRSKGLYSRLTRFLYKDVDLVLTSAEEATTQHREVFDFGDRVRTAQYPSDIDEHLTHPLREKEEGYTLLFANRLVDKYDPLLSIEIFDSVRKRHPRTNLVMNASGDLRHECEALINEKELQDDVQFLDQIDSWNDLHRVYRASDILILPASFSAGNFTIVESMASGMGIVISNKIIGVGAKDIQDGVNGYVCNADVNEFVNRIECYYQDSSLLKRHGQINKEIVRKYSIAETATLWNKLLSNGHS